MKKCVFCGQEFSELTEEHIIPNVICGRIKSKNLLCKNCNSWLGDNIDNAFDGVYNQIINMFKIKRERGTPQPVLVDDLNSEQQYLYKYGGEYELADVYINETPLHQNGFSFQIQGNKNKQQIKNKIGKILADKKQELEKLGIDYKQEIRKQHNIIDAGWAAISQNTHKFKPFMIKLKFDFGGKGVALAVLKIAYLFFKEVKPDIKIDDTEIINILKSQSDNVFDRCIYYSLASDLFKEIPDEISHYIYISGSKEKKKIIAYLKLFSITPYICILNDDYHGKDFNVSYGFNLLSQQIFTPICNELDTVSNLKELLDYAKNFDNTRIQIEKDISRIMDLYYKLNPKARYNELQLDVDMYLRTLVCDSIVDTELCQFCINNIKGDYTINLSEDNKIKCTKMFADAIINALDLILKQNNAIPNNSSLKQLFPQNPHQ